MFPFDEDRDSITDSTVIYNNVGKDEIQLYEQMSLAIELMNNKNFEVFNSEITNGNIYFGISTKYPEGLPENLGILFFNADKNFNVSIIETKCVFDINNRYYDINLKKV